ncbi:hypothetical protein FNV43_RR14427 [Rhamnella rubrinervis]|uniref:Uncharacterized protein n=1 Tax=Rhamnella rubrinervis TaxID=2594499 RepID=A0A8K0H343_9ROSA|nr:hypothetical protein FNV43_RR14427 [Rhamnella rubrinervis]
MHKRIDYYSKIGKAWKRELTAVKDNTDLKKLLMDTSNKSIIVIEDIDYSLDLTDQRNKKKDDEKDEDDGEI